MRHERDSQLVVLPELWSTGYDLENARDYADELGAGMFAQLSRTANDHSIAIFGSVLERRGAEFMNCAAYYDAARQPRWRLSQDPPLPPL